MTTVANQEFRLELAGVPYTLADTHHLRRFLEQQGTFEFPRLETGLFSAARLSAGAEYTGYDNVWVRDNVHIAHAHLVNGQTDIAVRNAEALGTYFQRHCHRFQAIITGQADPGDPMHRPHIRFNGRTLQENPGRWSQAQNDALGYFVWFFCRLALAGHVHPQSDQWEMLGRFALYFQAIRYWEDEDSGHWEEARKVEVSSIGAVVAGLRELRRLMLARSVTSLPCPEADVTVPLLDELIGAGERALNAILPNECIQADPAKRRPCDAAQLFLISPMEAVTETQADQILRNVETQLKGERGVRRYLGDSFWCADYKALQSPERRTADVSEDMSARDALLRPGQEAQWCLFDPLLSTIYGRRYAATGQAEDLERQVHYLNRSLGQLTGPDSGFAPFLCPELYYLEGGRYVPNDVTPLLWTQANLAVALVQMEDSARRRSAA